MLFIDIVQQFLEFDLAPEVISSLIVVLILCILAIYVGIRAHFQDPLKKPKGILFLAEFGVEFFDNMASGLMGKQFKDFGGYIMGIALYVFISFIFGLTGLPSPIAYLAVPLSLGLSSFVMIHATSIRFTKWKYFKRYIDPLPLFLPINLISMWAPLLSMALRLFGNAIAGTVIMSILYLGLEELSGMVFASLEPIIGQWNQVFLAPLVTWILHLYFDLWGAFIQTTVFISLTMIYVGQEAPEDFVED